MKPKKIALLVVITVWLVAGGWALRYAAGGAYLIAHKTDPRQVESTTWSDYWDSYKDDPKEKKRLQASMGFAAFLIFLLPLIVAAVAMSKSRSLHGDARWATKNEARDAELFEDDGLILGRHRRTDGRTSLDSVVPADRMEPDAS